MTEIEPTTWFSAAIQTLSRSRRRLLISLFLASLAIYLSNARIIAVDSAANSLLPVALLTRGSLTFDGLVDPSPLPPTYAATPRGIVCYYPIATGLMAVPIYALPVA